MEFTTVGQAIAYCADEGKKGNSPALMEHCRRILMRNNIPSFDDRTRWANVLNEADIDTYPTLHAIMLMCIPETVKEIGTCALCNSIIYADDSGHVLYKGALFCTVSCVQEATGEEILTGHQTESGYDCPYCGRHMGINEGSSETAESGRIMVGCEYCGRVSLSDGGLV